MGRKALAAMADPDDAGGVRHPELLPAFCFAIAAELAHLRWILLTQWKCRACGDPHIHCACKPAWVKKLL
jgi:hypothetical protein